MSKSPAPVPSMAALSAATRLECGILSSSVWIERMSTQRDFQFPPGKENALTRDVSGANLQMGKLDPDPSACHGPSLTTLGPELTLFRDIDFPILTVPIRGPGFRVLLS